MFKQILCLLLLMGSTVTAMQHSNRSHDENLILTGRLMQAALDLHPQHVANLLAEGANVHYKDKSGASILYHAAKRASVSGTEDEWNRANVVLVHLLRAKADTNTATITQETPLLALVNRVHYAHTRRLMSELIEAVQELINHGAQLDRIDASGRTAYDRLGIAVEHMPNNPEFNRLLEILKPSI